MLKEILFPWHEYKTGLYGDMAGYKWELIRKISHYKIEKSSETLSPGSMLSLLGPKMQPVYHQAH